MKNGTELSRLRALAAMGMPAETFIPAFLEALHACIPSDRNLFDWTDSEGRLIRYYFEGPIDPEIHQRYFEIFHNRREAEAMPSFREAIAGRAIVRSARELERPEFFRSALYNEIWRPQRLHTRIEAVVRGVRDQPLGSLVLYRGPGERSFSAADEALLERIVPYVARGLQVGAAGSSELGYSSRRGLRAVVCLDEQGTLMQLSSDALKLLLMVHGGITPMSASHGLRRDDYSVLSTIWQQHERAGRRQEIALTIDNAWGRFAFESCWLGGLGPGGRALLHVTIDHHERLEVSLRRAVDSLSLTPAQKEVCLLLRGGHAQDEVARVLGISATTVADHVKKIYARLDVHSVGELVQLIHRQADLRPPAAGRAASTVMSTPH